MKRIFSIMLLIVFLVILVPGAVFAAGEEEGGRSSAVFTSEEEEGEHPPRFIDYVGVLTPEEAAAVTEKLDEVSESRQFDTVIVIVPALDGRSARLYAADFYEEYGYGYGTGNDGIILLQAVEARDYGFATTGKGLSVFTESAQDTLEDAFVPYLRNDDYFRAYMAFAEGVDKAFAMQKTGFVILSLVIGLIVALIVTGVMRSQLKSVKPQKFANLYIRQGSMAVTDMRDYFLYKHTTRTMRSSSSSGGGSGFSSSSGSSFSGRSGKY